MPAAEDVDVQMGDSLAAVWAVVDDEAIAVFCEAGFFGDFTGFEQQMTKDFSVLGFGLGDAGKRLFGED